MNMNVRTTNYPQPWVYKSGEQYRKVGESKGSKGARDSEGGIDVSNQIVIRKRSIRGKSPYGLISAGALGNMGTLEESLKRRVTAVVNKADRLPLEGDR